MENTQLLVDLALAVGAAFIGGFIADRIGLPVLLGYIVAGVLIGPNTPGLVADVERVEVVANLGVAFLMFGLGVEFSLDELRKGQRSTLIAAGIQIPATMLLGFLAGQAIGWSGPASFVLGASFAFSSSIVALKLLLNRGEATSAQGTASLSLCVVQDLVVLPVIAVIPAISGGSDNLAQDLVTSLLVAGLLIVGTFVLGTRLVPRILEAVAATGSRELFLASIVLIAIGTALATHEVGLSLALGGFLAGLVVSESEFDDHVLSEMIPLRDLFAILFFVSLGMLLDPAYFVDNIGLILGLVALLVIGKFLITGTAFMVAGLDHRTAIISGLLLAQMAEFSFILAGAGRTEGIIGSDQYELILMVAIGSILVVPVLLQAAPAIVRVADTIPAIVRLEPILEDIDPPVSSSLRPVVIGGFGRVGQVVGDILDRRGMPYTVIDLNPVTVRDLRKRGVRALYGDVGREEMLLRAEVQRARVLVVSTIDLPSQLAAIRFARELNPRLSIVTRARNPAEVAMLREAGANEVVQPEFEAGLEFVRHVLRRHGVSSRELEILAVGRRAAFYGEQEDEASGFSPRRDDNL